jgi:hypothetical protein
MSFYSVRQDDFGVRVCFEARSDSEARVRSLFLLTALRGENCWGKRIHLSAVQPHEVQTPFFAGKYFEGLDPLLPRLRSYLGALVEHRLRKEAP